MKHIVFILLCNCVAFLAANDIFGQSKLNIDYSEIEQIVEVNKGLYDELFDRYCRLDTLLTLNDYALIYYGHSFSDSYEPMVFSNFNNLFREENYRESLDEAERVLSRNPVSIQALYNMMTALHVINNPDYKRYLNHYAAICSVIMASGDCTTPGTAMKVIYIPDEYEIMWKFLKIKELKKRPAREDEYDIFDVIPTEEYPFDIIYFDISRSRIRMREIFER